MVAVGHLTLDRVGQRKVLGGSAWYAACAWRGQGEQVRLVTAAGPDLPVLPRWRGLEVDIRLGPRTTEFSNVYLGDGRRRLLVHAQAPTVAPFGTPQPCEVLFLAPVLGEVPFEHWVQTTDARLVGVGLQGWLKHARADGEVAPRPDLIDPTDFDGADVACLSEEDLGGDDRWLARLTEVVPIIALTRAAAGCDVIVRGRTTRVATQPVEEVDATGAGDSFAAGFLRALARGADPPQAAAVGCELGAAAVRQVGAPTTG